MNSDYNSTGINTPQNLGSQSPVSNSGVVYEPANTPTNPGALKVARQTVDNLIFKTKNGGTINIGTQVTSPATTAGSAGIVIYDGIGDENNGLGHEVVFLADGSPVVLNISANPTADTPVPPFTVMQTANPNNSTEAGDFASAVVVSSHFTPMLFFSQYGSILDGSSMLYLSDGTDPNGVLNGEEGDVCFNGLNGGISHCLGGTVWSTSGGSGNTTNTYAGSVVSNAAAAYFPDGWSFSRTGAGIYTITHNLGTLDYSVNITPIGIVAYFAAAYTKTTTEFSVVITNPSTVPVDSNFDFIVTS